MEGLFAAGVEGLGECAPAAVLPGVAVDPEPPAPGESRPRIDTRRACSIAFRTEFSIAIVGIDTALKQEFKAFNNTQPVSIVALVVVGKFSHQRWIEWTS